MMRHEMGEEDRRIGKERRAKERKGKEGRGKDVFKVAG